MDAQAAARLGDEIAHGFGLAAMIAGAVAGAVIGAAIVAATVATGGAAAVIIAGCVAAGGLSMYQLVKGLTTIFNLPEPASGVLVTGSQNVYVNNRSAIRAGVDLATCTGFPFNHPPLPFPVLVAEGSSTVFVNGKPMSRLQSKIVCGAHVKSASPNTYVGGPSTAVAFVFDLEGWLHTGLEVLGIGALIGAGVMAALAGAVALVEFAAITGGTMLAFEGLGQLGDALGPGYRDMFQGIAGLGLLFAGPKLAGKNNASKEFPARTAESDAAVNTVKQAMKEAGISQKKGTAVGALVHEDGSVTVAVSGSAEKTAAIQSKLAGKLPENYKFGPPEATRPLENYTDPNTGKTYDGRTTCAEPKLFEGAANNSSKPSGMSVDWYGKPENPHPISPGNSGMEPCASCEHNEPVMTQWSTQPPSPPPANTATNSGTTLNSILSDNDQAPQPTH
jgi:uncharacterized Zn-binding protein involved in type VI secretion